LALAFWIKLISLLSASRKRVRMLISKLILARDRQRSRFVPKKEFDLDYASTIGNGEHVVSHLYSPSLEDSTSAKICDDWLLPVDDDDGEATFDWPRLI
jgi:hypothetical protein